MPFFAFQAMTVFGGAYFVFILFAVFDFFYWIGSAFVFHQLAGRKGGFLAITIAWTTFAFIVDLHNGIYMINKSYCRGDFYSSPTWNISSFIIVLVMLGAMTTAIYNKL